jgi:hypothetical protein
MPDRTWFAARQQVGELRNTHPTWCVILVHHLEGNTHMRVTSIRTASLTAASALAIASVSLIAAPAANAAPADPDVNGTVTNAAGAALAGVSVAAYTTPTDGSNPQFVDSAITNAAGQYSLTHLDPASLNVPSNSATTKAETEFKLYFSWSPQTPADYHTPGYLDRWLGGVKNRGASGTVVVPANAAAAAPTQVLPNAAGVLLTVTNPAGAPVNDYAYGSLYTAGAYDPQDAYATGASMESDDPFYPDTDNNPATNNAPKDGLVYLNGVEPGSYLVEGSGTDYNATTLVSTNYISRFFGGDGSYTGAKAIEAKSGAYTPVTIQLSSTLSALKSPRIIGNSSIGSKLKADPGTWLRQEGTDFKYQWLRGSTVVGTEDTYKVTKKDAKKKIQLVVTAYNGDFVGTASDKTTKVGQKSKVTAKKNKDGSIDVTVKVQKKSLVKKLGTPTGKVVLMTEDGETASKKVKLKGGHATLKPRAKFAGEKLTVMYLGNNRLGSDTATLGGGKKKK